MPFPGGSPTYHWPEPDPGGMNGYPEQMAAGLDAADATLAGYYPQDLFANRPAASVRGRRFFCSDPSGPHLGEIYLDTGTQWLLEYPIGGAGTNILATTSVPFGGTFSSGTTSGAYQDVDASLVLNFTLASMSDVDIYLEASAATTPDANQHWGITLDGSFVGISSTFIMAQTLISRCSLTVHLGAVAAGAHNVHWQFSPFGGGGSIGPVSIYTGTDLGVALMQATLSRT